MTPITSRFHLLLPVLIVLTGLGSGAHAASKDRCGLKQLDACINTNRLLGDPSFQEALSRFIGDRPAGWLYEDGTMLGQVRTVLGGPSDKPVRFSDKLIRFSACRFHSCDEKGAVVLTESGKIKAVGVIHFGISTAYSRDPIITILTQKRNESFLKIVDHLQQWYFSVIKTKNDLYKKSYLYDEEDYVKPRKIEIVYLN